MPKKSWTLEQLKKALSSRKDVKGWIITQEHVHRRERYFLLDGNALAIDQDRDVHVQSILARIMVPLNKPDRQGEITKKLFPSLPLAPQLDSAVAAALQTDYQAWSLPEKIASPLSDLKTTDPRMAEDLAGTMNDLTKRVKDCTAQKRPTVFSSAELFLAVHDRELHLSTGLVHRSSQSRAYAEAAYSMMEAPRSSERPKSGTSVPQSDEYLNMRWSVHLDDLAIEEIFAETTDRAEHSLDVSKPTTGKYPVIIDADVLATLFNTHVSQLSAQNAYHGLPFVKPGEDLIPEAKGDLITMTLDPFLPFGADTTVLSDQGIEQRPVKVVDRNRVITTLTDKQYADYLGTHPTTARGNLVIEAGKLSYTDLTKQAPLVMEILQFSGLFADPNSGTFSSEIRLAKLYDNRKGSVTYMKGGSLSGSITENFANARFSREVVKRAQFQSNSMQGSGYFGPAFVLLNDVSIVG